MSHFRNVLLSIALFPSAVEIGAYGRVTPLDATGPISNHVVRNFRESFVPGIDLNQGEKRRRDQYFLDNQPSE